MKKWERESWVGSEEKSAAFVENIMRKQSDKKVNPKKPKKTGPTSDLRRKRKRPVVVLDPGKRPAVSDPGDSASLPSTSSSVMERYNPKTTFTSFQQAAKMLHAFLNMCHDSTSDNHISEGVHNIVTMQVGLLETLMKTLQEHIR